MQILEDRVDCRQATSMAVLLLERFMPAEANQSCAPGFLCGHATTDVVLDEHRQVRFQFLFKVVIELAAFQERAAPRDDVFQGGDHTSPPRGKLQQTSDNARDPLPVLGFRSELLHATLCYGIELRLTLIFRRAPLGLDPPLLHKTYQAEVNGALIDLQRLFAELLDPARNAVSM